ncbi:hypothetical protein VII00023_18349 [Vibrio ichthyoenteri ATCC 700023]|uniref:DUF805 domain-containing protein n=1 Tax=Vibrio ichthyoenteri ATCC 700023 TaxID=870968 RepID=F9S0L4_9VIBR|nr:DUF805 domain-containing protein [Vibrio ichthyoenteri]EGU43156.1 hypothetical protein VII00023_18349 [Vibrio ichthyoenteri ATCC 700023]
MEWYLAVLKKYAVFSGRSRRKEYWMFFLINLIFTLLLGFVDGLLGTVVLGFVYSLAILIPSIAVGVRRLHDTGRTGWWLLISLIPIIGILVLIYFMVGDSAPGHNEYGPNPKGSDGMFI